jgi:hypothetical protein
LERALGSASKASSKTGKAFATLAKAGALVGVALGTVAVVGIKKSIDAASDLGEQISKTNVVFGKSGKEVQKWSEGLAESFGLSQRAALEAAGTYGNMLVPMGFSRAEAAKMSKQFVELAADMASFNNASPEETLDALRAGLAGETEPLRRFGVFLNDARIKSQAAAMGFKLVKGQLDPMAKAAATAAIIMKDTADTQGDFERTSGSLANQQRILKAELENSAAAIGQALLPAAVKLMGLLSQIVPVVTDFGIKMAEAVGPVLVTAIGNIAPMFERVKQAVLDLTTQVRNLWTTMQPILGAGFSAAMSTFGQSTIGATIAMIAAHAALVKLASALAAVRAAATGAALASLLTPIGLITAAVGLMTFGFLASRNASNSLSDSLNRQRDALKSLQDAADASVSAQDRLRDAHIAVKQATLSVASAIRQRNALEAAGKKGTDEFKQAQVNVQSAYANRIRAEHELASAQEGNTKAAGKQQAAIRHLGEDAEALRARMEKTTGSLQKMNAQSEKHQVVGLYAREMQKMAVQADKVAEATAKSNPKVAEAARNFAASARAAANYAKRTGEIPPALGKVAGPAQSAGRNVGTSFGLGLAAGINATVNTIATAAANAVRAAESAARAAARAKSPSELFAILGRDLVAGMVAGIVEKYASLSASGRTAVDKVISSAAAAISNAKGVFASAFDGLASAALAAFDKISSEFETKTERKIRRQDENRAKADRERALREARAALAQAQAPLTQREGESLEDFQARLDEQQRAIIEAKKAESEALFAIQRATDEKIAAQERKQYEASRERQRVNFEKQLDALEKQLEKGRISAQQFRQRVLALFEKFDVPFRNAGQALGAALASGLHDAFGDAAVAARRLINTIAAELKKVEFVVNVAVRQGGAEHRQHGGPVKRGSAYIVGEAGPELFIPSTSGRVATSMAGGTSLMADIRVPVYLDSTQIAEVVRREYLRFEKRNGRAAV